jgi:hypothetical protein
MPVERVRFRQRPAPLPSPVVPLGSDNGVNPARSHEIGSPSFGQHHDLFNRQVINRQL